MWCKKGNAVLKGVFFTNIMFFFPIVSGFLPLEYQNSF